MFKIKAMREAENKILELTAKCERLEFVCDKQQQDIEQLERDCQQRDEMIRDLTRRLDKVDDAMLKIEVADEEEKKKGSLNQQWMAGVR